MQHLSAFLIFPMHMVRGVCARLSSVRMDRTVEPVDSEKMKPDMCAASREVEAVKRAAEDGCARKR